MLTQEQNNRLTRVGPVHRDPAENEVLIFPIENYRYPGYKGTGGARTRFLVRQASRGGCQAKARAVRSGPSSTNPRTSRRSDTWSRLR
jgi:hypothetical protein